MHGMHGLVIKEGILYMHNNLIITPSLLLHYIVLNIFDMDVHQIGLNSDIACRHSLLPINAAMYREAIIFQLIISIAMPHVVGTLYYGKISWQWLKCIIKVYLL